MNESAVAEARAVLAPIKLESELAALPGQFVSLVPQETEVTRQTLEGVFLYALAELVQAEIRQAEERCQKESELRRQRRRAVRGR
jgi:hypothetical protein